jgi:hypothetical protein
MMLAVTSTTAAIWTAIGTLALALATFVSLFFARRSINQTQTAIELSQAQLTQTQEEITISRQEVEQAQRPVVVPVGDNRRMEVTGPGLGDTQATPVVYGTGRLLVPVENIGAGPALRLVASVKSLDEAGNPSGAPIGPQTPAQVAGLGTGVIMPLDIAVHGWQPGEINFQVDIEYEDVAGQAWKTTGQFVSGRYRAMTIE